MFDVSQTDGEPLPELETAAEGDANEFRPALEAVADGLGIEVTIVPPDEWSHGEAEGICSYGPAGEPSTVEVNARADDAALAGVLVHEYAHALLHSGASDDGERAARELEAEAVAYVVGRYFGLDTSGSAFYLAAWTDDEPDVVLERLERISRTATTIVDAIEAEP